MTDLLQDPTPDWNRARLETPGCDRCLHFNNAGASLMPQPVLDVTLHYLKQEAEMGGYEAAAYYKSATERVYSAAAQLLNCQPSEIAFIDNATRAWDMAFYSIPFETGDRILTTTAAYASNYIAFLQMARKTGVSVEVIPDDESGQVDLAALANAMDERVRLLAITHVPTSNGLINPAQEIGMIPRPDRCIYLLDACQSVGQMAVDVQKIGCDFLSVTGRKFLRGPRGTGFLYGRMGRVLELEPVFLDLNAAQWLEDDRYEVRPDARRFETWETNYAGKVGLGVAIDYALSWGLEAIGDRVQTLATQLRQQLAESPGVTVCDRGPNQSGIVTFTTEQRPPTQLKADLLAKNINVSVSYLPYARLDLGPRNLPEVLRASVHYYNTSEEVGYFYRTIHDMIS